MSNKRNYQNCKHHIFDFANILADCVRNDFSEEKN